MKIVSPSNSLILCLIHIFPIFFYSPTFTTMNVFVVGLVDNCINIGCKLIEMEQINYVFLI